MHTIFAYSPWEEEQIGNEDNDPRVSTTIPGDLKEGLEKKLPGCTYFKAIRKNEKYSAQIRVEERYRQTLIYYSALVICKDGRTIHDYDLKDLCYFKTKEFRFSPGEEEHPEFLAAVYEHVLKAKEEIERMYFP